MMKESRWLLRKPRPDAARRLFCFPFAGVGASAFRQWPSQIGDIEVCSVQLPGRENRIREPSYKNFENFAADAAQALLPHLDRPFAFFGHCMGALLAYALLVELSNKMLPLPSRYYVSSSLVPHLGFFGPFHPSMSDDQLADGLVKIMQTLGQKPPIPEMLALSVRVLRQDVEMCFGYCPPGPRRLPCPITAFGWMDDPDVRPEEMLPWREYGELQQQVLSGDNFTLLSAPPPLIRGIEASF